MAMLQKTLPKSCVATATTLLLLLTVTSSSAYLFGSDGDDIQQCSFMKVSHFKESYESVIPSNCMKGKIDWEYPFGNYTITLVKDNAQLCVTREYEPLQSTACSQSVNGKASVTLKAQPDVNGYWEPVTYTVTLKTR